VYGNPVSWVRIPLPPPLSCREPETRPHPRAFFFLFQRRLAKAPEPRRLAPGSMSVSERPSVSNRANLTPSGSASRRPTSSMGFAGRSHAHLLLAEQGVHDLDADDPWDLAHRAR